MFFCNSGAEANEAAIKLIRKHGLARGQPAIVALDGSFHGRTVAALAATGQPAKRAPFEPLVDWFRFVPPGDLEALRAAFAPGDVGGVLLEPVMGEGGVRPLDDAYLRLARELCDEHGALLVVDEVQSGLPVRGLARDLARRRGARRRVASRRRSAAGSRSGRSWRGRTSRSARGSTPRRSAAARCRRRRRSRCST